MAFGAVEQCITHTTEACDIRNLRAMAEVPLSLLETISGDFSNVESTAKELLARHHYKWTVECAVGENSQTRTEHGQQFAL